MAKTKQIPILGRKAIIFRNKYDVWQFRMYVKNARRYVEKSLRTKEQALAEERAEALKTVKRLCKQFNFTTGMLRGSLKK